MLSTSQIIKNAATKCGLVRSKYVEADLPSNPSNVCLFVFFGDIRSLSIASSILLKRYREEIKSSKYFIVCSWPGYEGLFPFASEYWSCGKEIESNIYWKNSGISNKSDAATALVRNLNHYFEDVITADVLLAYYDNGLKHEFFDEFNNIKVYKPYLPSPVVLGNEFNRDLAKKTGRKVVVTPYTYSEGWRSGARTYTMVKRKFWVDLVDKLLAEGFIPVIHQNNLTFDISSDFTDRAIYLRDSSILNIMSGFRTAGCVLDIFSSISKLAIAARTPFVSVGERGRFNGLKEYEIDDLTAKNIPRDYIFSFSSILEEENKILLNSGLFDLIIKKLDLLYADTERDLWPSTAETEELVLYDDVRKEKNKKLGIKFVKIPKI